MEKIKINIEAARSIIENNKVTGHKVLVRERKTKDGVMTKWADGKIMLEKYTFRNPYMMPFSILLDHRKEEYFLHCADIADVNIN